MWTWSLSETAEPVSRSLQPRRCWQYCKRLTKGSVLRSALLGRHPRERRNPQYGRNLTNSELISISTALENFKPQMLETSGICTFLESVALSSSGTRQRETNTKLIAWPMTRQYTSILLRCPILQHEDWLMYIPLPLRCCPPYFNRSWPK